MNNPMNQFVFVDRIQTELEIFLQNPELSPAVLCFYGYPGIGKTSFAKYWAGQVASDVVYEPMNEKQNATKGADVISCSVSLIPFVNSEEKPLSRVTVLDEFHNLAPKQQDSFKVALESLSETERVIICLNTDSSKPLKRQLTTPILSRCHAIDFDVRQSELAEFMRKCQARYSFLERDQIRRLVPDQRAMTRENKLAEARKRLRVA